MSFFPWMRFSVPLSMPLSMALFLSLPGLLGRKKRVNATGVSNTERNTWMPQPKRGPKNFYCEQWHLNTCYKVNRIFSLSQLPSYLNLNQLWSQTELMTTLLEVYELNALPREKSREHNFSLSLFLSLSLPHSCFLRGNENRVSGYKFHSRLREAISETNESTRKKREKTDDTNEHKKTQQQRERGREDMGLIREGITTANCPIHSVHWFSELQVLLSLSLSFHLFCSSVFPSYIYWCGHVSFTRVTERRKQESNWYEVKNLSVVKLTCPFYDLSNLFWWQTAFVVPVETVH